MPSGTVTPAGGGGSAALDGVLAYLAGNHAVALGGTIPWDSTLYDTGSYLNPATGKFALKAGVWRIETNIRGATSATVPNLQLLCYFDGPPADLFYLNMVKNDNNAFAASGVLLVYLSSADVWDMTVISTGDSGTPTVYGGLGGSRVALTYLGALPT